MIHQLKIQYLVLALLPIYTCVNGATVYSEIGYSGIDCELTPTEYYVSTSVVIGIKLSIYCLAE
ncbi:hypothetical protein BJ944DRAFT_242877 [Cunninghamella echinulata]|nr:hypothetical protein BJ944DRAFT_242877 [Cunninghamella echinulata]